jgi:hypothetical protein
MKWIAIALALTLAGCTAEVEAPKAPIESPLNQPAPVVEQLKNKEKAKEKGTPRLDALERRVRKIEVEIQAYKTKYGQ